MTIHTVKTITAGLFLVAAVSCTTTASSSARRTEPPPPIPVVVTSLDTPAVDVAARWGRLYVEPGVPQLMQPAKVHLLGQMTFEDPARIIGVASIVLDHVVTPDGSDLMANRPPETAPTFFWPVPAEQQAGRAPLSLHVLLPTPTALPEAFRQVAGRAYVLWADDYRTFDLPIGKPTAYPGQPAKPGKWQKLAQDFEIRLTNSEVGPRSVEVQTEYRARADAQVHFQGWIQDLPTPFIARATLVGTSSPDYTLSPLGGGGRPEGFSGLVHGTAGKYAGFSQPVDYSTLRLLVARKVSVREIHFNLRDLPTAPPAPASGPHIEGFGRP